MESNVQKLLKDIKADLNKLAGMLRIPLMVPKEEIGVLNEKSSTFVEHEYETIT